MKRKTFSRLLVYSTVLLESYYSSIKLWCHRSLQAVCKWVQSVKIEMWLGIAVLFLTVSNFTYTICKDFIVADYEVLARVICSLIGLPGAFILCFGVLLLPWLMFELHIAPQLGGDTKFCLKRLFRCIHMEEWFERNIRFLTYVFLATLVGLALAMAILCLYYVYAP